MAREGHASLLKEYDEASGKNHIKEVDCLYIQKRKKERKKEFVVGAVR